ncbi:MAG: DUF2867 domain-containing protein [Bacteroidales bacterium]|nr:DUF2867 domain-containing protein [Bacteroidales bacterium]
MKILLTGATGYIGKRILPVLISKGHTVICCVRDKKRFTPKESLLPFIEVIEVDLLNKESLKNIPEDIDGAYYLVHSMSTSKDYQLLEEQSAINFREAINNTSAKHVIYLSGIVNDKSLSKHLSSRKNVENELSKGKYSLTTLRAGIIIGSGSASFEIIRDLVEKLPFMITPKWLNTKCQPIGISNVIEMLVATLFNQSAYNQNFDIGGSDILTYKQMLLLFAKVRKLKRFIFILPIMTPKLSSYWLFFVTSISYKLAIALVDSMKVEVICNDNRINDLLGIKPISYQESLERSFKKIQQNEVISSWRDSLVSGHLNIQISDFIDVPSYGCYKGKQQRKLNNKKESIERIWKIGGKNGWYYANWLWRLRGFLDILVGGVGLKRGRTDNNNLEVGDAIDFWRVLYSDKEKGRLLLFAEMKLPGEAWLEFSINDDQLIQSATFRPKGIFGRLYWIFLIPFHNILFKGLLKKLTK